MKWGKPNFAGKRYDLTHLDPTVIVVPGWEGKPAVRVRVLFGAHCFTEGWKQGDPEDFKFMDGKTARRFCTVRYADSIHLPGLVGWSVGSRVLLSHQQRFVIVGNPKGVPHPYAVFFRLRKAGKNYDAVMDVVSAHQRPNLHNMKGMAFSRLARLIVDGQQIQWPKKK